MTLIKISNQNSNKLRLKFEQQLNLNPDKKYMLGLVQMSFSRDEIEIKDFEYTMKCNCKDGNYAYKYEIDGKFSLEKLEKTLQKKVTDMINRIQKKYENEKREDLISDLKNMKIDKIKLQKSLVYDQTYSLIFNTPLEIEISNPGNFCDLLGLDCKDSVFKPNKNYVSEYNPKIIKPFSILEVHCNITTKSYSNHDSHAHSHNEHELLYVSFIDKLILPTTQYMEKPKKIMHVPIEEGLREIREIELTLLDDKHNPIRDINSIVVYLQLLEK